MPADIGKQSPDAESTTITIDVGAAGPSSNTWLSARRDASRRMLIANSVIWALLVLAVIAHVVAAGEFFRYLWNDINHGLALFAACAVTVFWVVDYQMINTVTSTGAAWMTPTSQKCARW